MKFHSSSKCHFALAEQNWDGSTLYCISSDGKVVKYETPEKITGISFIGEKLYCAAHVRDKESYAEKIVLHTFDAELKELSCEELTEDSRYDRLSAIEGELLYILDFATASTGFKGGSRTFDLVDELNFTKINIYTGEHSEWVLADWNDGECSNALDRLTNGYVTDIDAMFIFDDRLMLKCKVYDPDSVVETDDPDFNEDEMSDDEYIEWHSNVETICADIGRKKLTSVWRFYSEFNNVGKYKLPFGGPEQQILNAVTLGSRTYLATDFNFFCISTCNGKFAVTCWYRMGYNPQDESNTKFEKYRCFYAWNDKLVFEIQQDHEITGFRICPATFEMPNEQEWIEVSLK